jgi:hypothetical protein
MNELDPKPAVFVADSMDGFPPGTAPGPPVVQSWHAPLHFMTGGIGFLGLRRAGSSFAGQTVGAFR